VIGVSFFGVYRSDLEEMGYIFPIQWVLEINSYMNLFDGLNDFQFQCFKLNISGYCSEWTCQVGYVLFITVTFKFFDFGSSQILKIKRFILKMLDNTNCTLIFTPLQVEIESSQIKRIFFSIVELLAEVQNLEMTED
jgi:hypothetical protein